MKKFLVLSLILAAMATNNSQAQAQEKVLRHVVMFKFKDGADPAGIKKVEDAFRALPSKIKEIKSIEWGKNNSA